MEYCSDESWDLSYKYFYPDRQTEITIPDFVSEFINYIELYGDIPWDSGTYVI